MEIRFYPFTNKLGFVSLWQNETFRENEEDRRANSALTRSLFWPLLTFEVVFTLKGFHNVNYGAVT